MWLLGQAQFVYRESYRNHGYGYEHPKPGVENMQQVKTAVLEKTSVYTVSEMCQDDGTGEKHRSTHRQIASSDGVSDVGLFQPTPVRIE